MFSLSLIDVFTKKKRHPALMNIKKQRVIVDRNIIKLISKVFLGSHYMVFTNRQELNQLDNLKINQILKRWK